MAQKKLPDVRLVYALTGQGEWDVHRDGCADVTRALRRRGYQQKPMSIQASTNDQIIGQIIDETTRELGYDENDVNIYMCVDKAFAQALLASQANPTPTEAAFAGLDQNRRNSLLQGVFEILEYDEKGQPGGEWSSDTTQALGELFSSYGVVFTTPEPYGESGK